MPKKIKVLYFSEDTLRLKEVKGARTKLAATILFVAVILVGLVVAINYLGKDMMGLGIDKTNILKNENTILKAQLSNLTDRLQSLESAITKLVQRDNELRMLSDLPRLTEDLFKAGTGGTKENYDFGISTQANDLLQRTNTLLDQLERQVQIQQSSYSGIVQKMDYNKEFFKHLPAIKPTSGYYSVNGFGMRLHPVFHDYRFHSGLDITTEEGTPIYAAAEGVVEFTGNRGTYGRAIEIDHGYGYKTLYAHLSASLVKEGEKVKRGSLIGRVGRTGVTTGPHLHYEVIKNGVHINPIDYFFDEAEPKVNVATK